MKRIITSIVLLVMTMHAHAQMTLSLDSCRILALSNNKSLRAARLQLDMARNTASAAKARRLPRVEALGGYELTSRQVSLLSDESKHALSNAGTLLTSSMQGELSGALATLTQQGVITPQQAMGLGSLAEQLSPKMQESLNALGQKVVDAFKSDTRQMFAVSINVSQPLYTGGAITAANNMAMIGEDMAANNIEMSTQRTIHEIENAYWTVVSVRHKKRLAESYLQVVRKLHGDVEKMIREGIATKADGLKVAVKVNEAEMTLTQADNALALSKMLLCQLCGLPADTRITLADENSDSIISATDSQDICKGNSVDNRPELMLMNDNVSLSRQKTKLTRAAYLPQVMLSGGWLATNPSVYNGFEKKFSGIWNVGIMVRVPLWNWMEGSYKVRASKITTTMLSLETDEMREKMELQVSQSRFRMDEAAKRLAMTITNVANAEENLRCANVGFREGVLPATDVMEAQTAWLKAQSMKIDAEIDMKLSEINLKKALGVLR